jgi:hypothetical protein
MFQHGQEYVRNILTSSEGRSTVCSFIVDSYKLSSVLDVMSSIQSGDMDDVIDIKIGKNMEILMKSVNVVKDSIDILDIEGSACLTVNKALLQDVLRLCSGEISFSVIAIDGNIKLYMIYQEIDSLKSFYVCSVHG